MIDHPFYKICEMCAHYVQTPGSGKDKVCTRFPYHIIRSAESTCGEWTCARCWLPWEMVIQDEEDPKIITLIDHSKCPIVERGNLGEFLDD